jgi:hypothetical protein
MRYLRSGDDAGPAHSIIKENEGRYETTCAPVTDGSGGYLGTVMVIRDIAERRHLENRLLDAERLSGLGQMSAQIAHELRNPLNAIGGAAQYLARRLADEPEVGEYAALIGEEVQRVNRFIADLLKVACPSDPVLAPGAAEGIRAPRRQAPRSRRRGRIQGNQAREVVFSLRQESRVARITGRAAFGRAGSRALISSRARVMASGLLP